MIRYPYPYPLPATRFPLPATRFENASYPLPETE